MKLSQFIACTLVSAPVLAQVPPKPVSPKPPENLVLPPGWIVIVPPETPGSGSAKPFQVPKEWLYSKPDGVPQGKPAMFTGVPGESAQGAWGDFIAKSTADDALLRAQSLAINALKDRVEKLEAKLKEIESRGGAKK